MSFAYFEDVLRGCPSLMKTGCPSRMSFAGVLRGCPSRMSFADVLRGHFEDVLRGHFEDVLRGCPSRTFWGCPSRTSFAGILRMSFADVLRGRPSQKSSKNDSRGAQNSEIRASSPLCFFFWKHAGIWPPFLCALQPKNFRIQGVPWATERSLGSSRHKFPHKKRGHENSFRSAKILIFNASHRCPGGSCGGSENIGSELEISNLSSRCRIWTRDVESELEMSNLSSRCRIWARDVESGLEMSNLSSRCRIWAQNVESELKMSNLGSKCRIWVQDVESELKMSNLSSKCRIWAQNVESELKMSNLSSKCRIWAQNVESELKIPHIVPQEKVRKKKIRKFFFHLLCGNLCSRHGMLISYKTVLFHGEFTFRVAARFPRFTRDVLKNSRIRLFFSEFFFPHWTFLELRFGISSSDSASRAQIRHFELRFDISSSDSTSRAQIRHLERRFDIFRPKSGFIDQETSIWLTRHQFDV